jgi:hypothetical protein
MIAFAFEEFLPILVEYVVQPVWDYLVRIPVG